MQLATVKEIDAPSELQLPKGYPACGKERRSHEISVKMTMKGELCCKKRFNRWTFCSPMKSLRGSAEPSYIHIVCTTKYMQISARQDLDERQKKRTVKFTLRFDNSNDAVPSRFHHITAIAANT